MSGIIQTVSRAQEPVSEYNIEWVRQYRTSKRGQPAVLRRGDGSGGGSLVLAGRRGRRSMAPMNIWCGRFALASGAGLADSYLVVQLGTTPDLAGGLRPAKGGIRNMCQDLATLSAAGHDGTWSGCSSSRSGLGGMPLVTHRM